MPDPLTGLATRDELFESYERLVQSGGPAACIFIDLDGMKGFNEAVGHVLGDEALVAMARRVTAAVGPDAVVARIGGDEFLVLSGHLDLADVREAAERIATEAIATPVLRTETPHTLTESEVNQARGRVFFFGPDERGHLAIAPVRGGRPALPLVEPSPGAMVASAYLSVTAGVGAIAVADTDYNELFRAAYEDTFAQKRGLATWRDRLRLAQEDL